MTETSTHQEKIWMDGELKEWEEATVHVLSRTFNYGHGVFDTVRFYATESGTAVFRLDAHIKRLFRSGKIAKVKIPFSTDELTEAVKTVAKVNQLKFAYCRVGIYLDHKDLGIHTQNNESHAVVAAWDLSKYLHRKADEGIKVIISSWPHFHPNSGLIKSKTNGRYINSIMLTEEAYERGVDDAIFLDHEGYLAEASVANLFLVKDGKLYTPTLKSILDGITRDSVIQIANDLGIEVIETNLTRDHLYDADESFITGTAIELNPIAEVDSRPIGDGKVGEVYKKIQDKFMKIVTGKDKQYEHWLTHVAF